MSDSPGLVDFAIGLVIFVLNLPDGRVLFFGGNSNYRRIVINPANQKGYFWFFFLGTQKAGHFARCSLPRLRKLGLRIIA